MIKALSDKDIIEFSNNYKLYIPSNHFVSNIGYYIGTKLVGILSFSIIYNRCEINNIFVISEYRGRHIATGLIDYLLKVCKSCENITLEVRKSNDEAINLYNNFGFKSVAIRKQYYGNEDGILMMLEVGE